MEHKYLRPREVEQIYRINAKTLANWRSQGKGPSYLRIGGRIFYQVHKLKRYIRGCKVKTVDSE